MRTKRLFLFSSALVLILALLFCAEAATGKRKVKNKVSAKVKRELTLRAMEDSLLGNVRNEDLLEDEVYQKLAHEGWSVPEIVRIMGTALKDKKTAKKKFGYGTYAKQWLADIHRMPGHDTLYRHTDTVASAAVRRSIERAVPEDILNKYWEPLPYVPPRDRDAASRRLPGYFREPKFKPSCGRIQSIALHPEDPDRLYCSPDGAGIFKTDNLGVHWVNITDRIPNRSDRSRMGGYGIPVDPDDWDHIFAFMNNNTVYETCDGGDSWRKIQGATHKGFKRSHCFRDADGNLKFLGCTRSGNNGIVWISEDTCKTWTGVTLPDDMKEVHPASGARWIWFQEMRTDPSDRNKIYLPTSRSIYYFDDGARSEIVDGRRVYNIKRLHFTVHNDAGERVFPTFEGDLGADMESDMIFPCPATAPGNMLINPNNPDQWWFATGTSLAGASSAMYRSEDHGRTWLQVHDPAFGVGSGRVFGNELAGPWLGGFGVNFKDTSKVYGCSMSSAKSFDGGRTFSDYIWWAHIRAQQPGDSRWIKVSATDHNADNHYIASHKSGRVFRGSDGGMLCLDPDIAGGDWFNIGGDMGQTLFYWIAVNEFGDQTIMGNTQDINGQTYRYGRWSKQYGYEGSEAWVNPYSNQCYISGGMSGRNGWDPAYVSMSSWRTADTKADVVTNSWFFTRRGGGTDAMTFNRCDDYGKTAVNLQPIIGEGIDYLGKFALCRDKGRSTVFVLTKSNMLKRSVDGGNSFEPVLWRGTPAKFSNAVMAADPDNSDILYLGLTGRVVRLDLVNFTLTDIGAGLPDKLGCTQLMFHEGSGDLYFYNAGTAGIYLLEYDKATGRYADQWRFWVKGYNSGKTSNAVINYTTQEMVICDYGVSAWAADLEHPSDRYFNHGFALRELSFKDGRRTLGIDTDWTIPLYYHYRWTINGQDADNPYQYLTRELQAGDRVQLTLTLRESPDVSTTSAEYTVRPKGNPDANTPEASSSPKRANASSDFSYDSGLVRTPGHSLYSNGKGRVDLGYSDSFFGDFTIDFWLKPMSNGTLLCNTAEYFDQKGFLIKVDAGYLRFVYYPRNSTVQPLYETAFAQSQTISAPIDYAKWSHVAITQKRPGEVAVYINGVKLASATRIIPEATLNNSMNLALFADGIERNTIEAYVDELKIWTRALDTEEVRREMYATNADNRDGLAAYYSFNGGSLENDTEAFSGRGIRSRLHAETRHQPMTVPTCARHALYERVEGVAAHTFAAGDSPLLSIKARQAPAKSPAAVAAPDVTPDLTGTFALYVYDAAQWQNEEDNLDTDFLSYYPAGYLLHTFDSTPLSDEVELEFLPAEGQFKDGPQYRLYVTDPNADKQVWVNKGDLSYNADTGGLTLAGITLADIVDKKMLVIQTSPSIEIVVEGMDEKGMLPVYDETMSSFAMTANVLGGLPTPSDVYTIQSDGILRPSGLYFVEGKAAGELRLDLGKLGALNTSVRTTLRSDDNAVKLDSTGRRRPSLVPLTVDVLNRISPRPLGTGLRLSKAVAEIGHPDDYKALLNSRNFTLMGWVRVDDEAILSSGGYSLMTWRDRDNRGNGLMLEKGVLRAVVNWVKLNQSSLAITPSDIGNWIHLALVVTPSQIRYYKNGVEHAVNQNISAVTTGVGPFCLGKTTAAGVSGNDNFDGAFDQVATWSRALTRDEILKYMYTTVPLNDPGLMSYANMDYTDDSGIARDCFNLGEIKLTPTVALSGEARWGEECTAPYDARAIVAATDSESPVALEFAPGKERSASVATFRGAPHCYLNHDFQEYTALNQEFYGITYSDPLTAAKQPAADETVRITYRHHTVGEGDLLAVALRATGSYGHLAGFIHASEVSDGTAVFDVPASYLAHASEMMVFTYPTPDGSGSVRAANIQLSLGRAILPNVDYEDGKPLITLPDDTESIPVTADIIGLGSNPGSPVKIVLDRSSFASLSQENIDFSKTENSFSLLIDRSKIDPFRKNTVTIDLEAAKSNQLEVNFCLAPYVHLSLENGEVREVMTPQEYEDGDVDADDSLRQCLRALAEETASLPANAFDSESPLANLEIKAELVEGYIPDGRKVELEVISDMPTAMTIGIGNLLNDQSARIEGLAHEPSLHGAYHEGWNLVGNPYLTNINITKEQNVEFNPDHLTRFVYHCNPATGNYEVFDMTRYEASHLIAPFQSYFVQALVDAAEFTVTPISKEKAFTKRTRQFAVAEKKELSLALCAGGEPRDRLTVFADADASDRFATGEDAAKMHNLDGSSPELWALTSDRHEVAVTTIDEASDSAIPVYVKGESGSTMSLQCTALSGFGDVPVKVVDNTEGSEWTPRPGESLEFTLATDAPAPASDDEWEPDPNSRFTVVVGKSLPTGLDHLVSHGYRVEVEGNTCIVSGLRGDALVSVFSADGLKVAQERTAQPVWSRTLGQGLFIVTIHEKGKDYFSKIMVQ